MYRIGEWVRVGKGTKAKVILVDNLEPKIKIEHLNGTQKWLCSDQVDGICPYCDTDKHRRKSGGDFYPLDEDDVNVCISPSYVSSESLLRVTVPIGERDTNGQSDAITREFIIFFCPICGTNIEGVKEDEKE